MAMQASSICRRKRSHWTRGDYTEHFERLAARRYESRKTNRTKAAQVAWNAAGLTIRFKKDDKLFEGTISSYLNTENAFSVRLTRAPRGYAFPKAKIEIDQVTFI